MASMQLLCEWIDAEGGHSQRLVPATLPNEGRTMILSGGAAAADDELLCVPHQCLLTPSHGMRSASGAVVIAAGGLVAAPFRQHTLWLALALLLARGRQLGSTDKERDLWSAYADTLPLVSECESFPLMWPAETLQQLRHTSVGRCAARGQEALRSCWQLLERVCPSLCASCGASSQLCWAVSMAQSRALCHPDGGVFMCPYADLANHCESPEIEWEVSGTGSLLFCATAAAEVGAPMRICYGRKSPQQMLWTYGFVPAAPWHATEYAFQLELHATFELLNHPAGDEPTLAVPGWWHIHAGESAVVSIGIGPCSKQLQSALALPRLANLSEREWAVVDDECGGQGECVLARMGRAVGMANERRALEGLRGAIEAHRSDWGAKGRTAEAQSLSLLELQLTEWVDQIKAMEEEVAQAILYVIRVALLILDGNVVAARESVSELQVGAYDEFVTTVLADFSKALHCQLVMLGGLMSDEDHNAGPPQSQIVGTIETILKQLRVGVLCNLAECESGSDDSSDEGDCLDPVFLYNLNVMLD